MGRAANSLGERVGVLCGGPSQEREISLRSGRAIHEALLQKGYPAVLLELSRDPRKIPATLARSNISYAFIALHGPFGEDGKVQSLLRRLKIPYTGSAPAACRLGMDKWLSRRRWAQAGLPVPKTALAGSHEALLKGNGLSFPMVVKPAGQGSSFGISMVDSRKELARAIQQAAPYGQKILLEEYLSGPELTVGILEDRPLPVIQIVPKRRFYDFVAKYTPGQTEYRVPAPLPQEVARLAQRIALRAHRALGCRSFSRVDMIWVKARGPVLLELNTIPGMTATSLLPKAAQAVGIDFAELCSRMLASAFRAGPPSADERRWGGDKMMGVKV